MLTYKAAQVIAINVQEPKPWAMGGREGVTHSAKMAVFGEDANAVSITVKAKTADDLKAKLSKFTIGKPAHIPILDVVPVFKSGDRKAASYEYTA